MLVCPKCKCEYEEGYTVCNDCNCELVRVPEATYENVPAKRTQEIIRLDRRSLTFGAVFVIGIIILISSTGLADTEMAIIMKAHGGSMDTSYYLIYLEQTIIKYRTLGCILSVLGGLGVLINTRIRK
ncbi:hypothetical protein [Clostridium fungisolvens]|uniref:Uncharacterized protein n=1 Tax=Clostridium fungisolvens TaxID=1604897 RepID=A0A6V8SIE2_9CLOT|nr:hypothetical protein [Clostridium fungisolvens]GFP76285.1 hypothetical protein bsdtw1_02387 [Clostridium fungisolvens]